jgi:stearoyl-CoA desaturase (Delta-9 desaturase)
MIAHAQELCVGQSAIPERAYGTQQWPPPKVALTLHALRHVGFVLAIFCIPLNFSICTLLVAGYMVRMWGVEAINHRYFAHRAFATSRVFQFILGLLAAQAAARGPLWWAYIHRRHHSYPDTPEDIHSPVTHSFMHAYFVWLTVPENRQTDLDRIPDLAQFAELRWLNKYSDDVVFGVGTLLLGIAGNFGLLGTHIDAWSAVLWGAFAPAVLVLHSTGLLSTLCHMQKVPGGYRRYNTRDQSINRPVLALLTMGAGYHNNHHRCPSHARSGFAWYEIDFSYYILRALELVGLIWNVRSDIPEKIRREGGIQ